MRILKTISALMMFASLWLAVSVGAQQTVDSLPPTFPGSGGFPESIERGDLPPAYPEWPERPVPRPMIPPPPRGPYMSSALSEIDAFPEDMSGGLDDEFPGQFMRSPHFEADMPWPEIPEMGEPRVWMPESGEYHYVPEEVMRELEAPARYLRPPPVYPPYPGYPPMPPMRQPGFGYR
jgi:hypothetical protein